MREAIAAIERGAPVAPVLETLKAALIDGGFASVEYAELRHAQTLVPLTALTGEAARLLVAARIGKARLIDNMALEAQTG
jgi:pantoate--beta-alanine ligase